MRKILLTALSFLFLQIAFSQAKTLQNTAFTYYIEVTGINTKQAAADFQNKVKQHKEVTNFAGYGIPRSFFVLYTITEISKETFDSWINNSAYSIKVYMKKDITPEFLLQRKMSKKSILDIKTEQRK